MPLITYEIKLKAKFIFTGPRTITIYRGCSFITCDGGPAISLVGHFQNPDSFLESQVSERHMGSF